MSKTKLKLNELITLAELIDFKEPDDDISNWDKSHILMKAISDMLKNPIQKQAIQIMAQNCTPMSVLSKKYLTEYIERNSTVKL
tara:strand:- start:130 stop:381 length:252 start_codon:yes stop_codon:yes gene_type:complete